MSVSTLKPKPMAAVHGDAVPYSEFTLVTERELVYQAIMETDVWYALGRHVDGAALRDPEAQALMQAARLVHARGVPISYASVVQQLQFRVHSREMAPEELGGIERWFDSVESDTRRAKPALISDVAPTLRQRRRADVIASMIQRNAIADPDSKFADLAVELERADQIGELGKAVEAATIDKHVWNLIARLQHQDRLELGIAELDDYMDGGAPRGGIVTIGGDPGDGKSVLLTDACVHNVLKGLRCVYISLEMGVPQTMLRVLANLTGETQASVSRCSPEARQKLDSIQHMLGPLHMGYLSQGSTVEDLRELLDDLRENDPRFADGWDVLFVDYGDLMGSSNSADQNDYHIAKTVWGGLRGIASENQNWVVTASQLKDTAQRKGTVNDFADSKHKGRITDTGLLIGRGEDDDQVRTILVAKYRDGQSGKKIGPMLPDFARGRFHDRTDEIAESWVDSVDDLDAEAAQGAQQ